MVVMTNALFVTTSCDALAPDHPTGLWLEEFAVPYMAAIDAGIDITVASPRGGAVPLDPKTEPNDKQRKEWAPALESLRHSVTLESVKDQAFDAVFIPGGHGPMMDLAHDATLHELLARQDAAGRLIAAVCHGPAALVNVTLSDGTPLVAGKKLAAFTDSEEHAVQLQDVVPFLLASTLVERGADHQGAPDWSVNVVVDGRLVTGQNPQSASGVGAAMRTLLVGAA